MLGGCCEAQPDTTEPNGRISSASPSEDRNHNADSLAGPYILIIKYLPSPAIHTVAGLMSLNWQAIPSVIFRIAPCQ